nr:hypothetical protein [Clostridia bacterium]
MMEELLLGIDVGTTSVKASLYSSSHLQVASACRNYSLETPENNQVEFPAEDYWNIVCQMTRKLALQSRGKIIAVSLSCQGETLICVDSSGKPLRKAIVWLDNRACRESAELKKVFSRRSIYEVSGQAEMVATWPAAKILWLKRNEPDLFEHTAHFLLLADYLVLKMTGQVIGDSNLWASSTMLNIHSGQWWPEMLEYLGLKVHRLPLIVPCATPIGKILPLAAEQMGLSPYCTVVAGALDQTCNMIGCGMTHNGAVLETTGSCLAVGAILDHFVPYDAHVKLTCQNFAIPGCYTVLQWSQSAGMTLKWFAQQFYPEKTDPETAYRIIDQEAGTVQPGSDGLVMLPHLTGAANPEYDSDAAGVFAGIRLGHSRAHFARAIMESVACMLRRNLEQIVSLGIDMDHVFCAGGGASSALWLQIKADLTGLRMIPIQTRDSACHGAAILAGFGSGLLDSLHWKGPLTEGHTVIPDDHNRTVYDKTYRNYVQLYESLKPYFAIAGGTVT